MCRMLDYAQVKYEYENKYFDLKNGSILIIDFYLHDDFEFIKKGHFEIKGWKDKKGYYSAKEKFDVFRELYPEEFKKLTILFQGSDEWMELENKYKPLLPMWETCDRNRRTHTEIYTIDEKNVKEEWDADEFVICPLCLEEGKGLML